jgi:uncharacterized protein
VRNWPYILAYIISLLLGAPFLLITFIGFLVAFRSKWVSMLKNGAYRQLITWGLLGAVLSLLVQYVWFQVQTKIFNHIPESMNTNQLLESIKTNPGMIVVICVVCPVLEEIVFRKMVFKSFRNKFGTVAAATMTAFLFSLIHFDFVNTLVYVLIGLTFSWIYVKSKTIAAPIVSHIAMNSVVLIILS